MENSGTNYFGEKEILMLQKAYETAVQYTVQYGLQAIYGLIILFVGIKVAGWVSRVAEDAMKKKRVDVALAKFIAEAIKIAVIAFAILIALDKFGITISPLIAAISATIFGASFALQAPLANYAAGLSIIVSRPFTIGDSVAIKEFSGVVEDIKLPYTVLIGSTGERITIPNKQIVGEVIVNAKGLKMSETSIGIGYADDVEKAIRLVLETLNTFPSVSKNPAPKVGIGSFGDSAINIRIRYWVPINDSADTLHNVHLLLLKNFRQNKVCIPFPQQEVRILNASELSGTHSAAQR